jgi:hypothetical protein
MATRQSNTALGRNPNMECDLMRRNALQESVAASCRR